jgi:hypothetical protein
MTRKLFGRALGGLLLACGGAVAADLAAPSAALVPAQVSPPQPAASGQQPPPASSALADALAAAPRPPSEDREPREGPNPHMIGDFPAVFVPRLFFIPALQTVSTSQSVTQTTFVNVLIQGISGELVTVRVPVTTTNQVPLLRQTVVEVPVTARVPFPFRGDFNVAENESPRPQDRVFFNYNYYSNLGAGAGLPHQDTTVTTLNGNPAIVTTLTPAVAPRTDLHREVAGFEKTFLGGDASVELRGPVMEQTGAIDGSNFGDVTVLFKYAFWNDRLTGDVLSAGLALTLPTGPDVSLVAGGDMHPTLLQPWAGYVWNFDRLYVQGFTSLVVPTDSRDVTILFNDVGVGYALYRSAGDHLLSAVVPTAEVHVTTPLNHRDATSAVTVPDLVVLTAGAHFEIARDALLSVGVATSLTGPRAFDVEAVVQLNWRF